MCDLNEGFKLCSCDGDKLPIEKIDWILERRNEELPFRVRKGMAAQNYIGGHEKYIKSIIATHLNAKNCFDFDYEPKEDDLLKIKKRENGARHWYSYRFVAGKWEEDNSTSFDSWRSQHERYRNGKNQENINDLFDEQAESMLTPDDLEEQNKKSNAILKQLEAMRAKVVKKEEEEQKKKTDAVQEQLEAMKAKIIKMEVEEKLQNLKKLRATGVITEEEFNSQKAELEK
ncbi:MAG: SHOCT domain-containing protein [Aureispira sp.]|nr:SHOCT domain-containing protein [Aureispira sp.]